MANIYDLTDSWNDAGATFAAIRMDVTDTASQASSMLIDLQVGGVSRFAIRKDGMAVTPALALSATVTATGANQGAAAAIAATWNSIEGGAGDTGVILPAAALGASVYVLNNTSTRKIVYPASGEALGRQAANGGGKLDPYCGTFLFCSTAGVWWPGMGGLFAGLGLSPVRASVSTDTLTLNSPNGGIQVNLRGDQGLIQSFSPIHIYNSNGAFGGLTIKGAGNNNGGSIATEVDSNLIFNISAPNTVFYKALKITSPNSAVNNSVLTAAAAGAAPIWAVEGSDTNIDWKATAKGSGTFQFGSAGMFAANGSVATALSSVGPTGANTTVQEWLAVKNAAGTVRYIPCF